jgi:regulatory protein
MAAISEAHDPLGGALALAYRHLNRRERTVHELRSHLLEHGVEPELTDAAIEELIDQRYLDDARFARTFAEDKRTLEQWGAERIRRALLARGIDRELLDATLAADTGGGELERAVALLHRRFPEAPRDRRDRERALGVLLRKGYDSEIALDALSAFSRPASDRGGRR